MPVNLEIKAHLTDVQSAVRIARSIQADRVGTLLQKDTYYQVPHGRLKLRQIRGDHSELIFYQRAESSSQRKSDFHILEINDPVKTEKFLHRALPIVGVVSKKRILFLIDGARIHIDEVNGLGCFLEFEVPVTSTLASARKRLKELINKFGIKDKDFIKNSYIDCLAGKKRGKNGWWAK